jgi:hypothetical protein
LILFKNVFYKWTFQKLIPDLNTLKDVSLIELRAPKASMSFPPRQNGAKYKGDGAIDVLL